jgi:peptidoglycan/LPS O-acetylase OafA/YrhL
MKERFEVLDIFRGLFSSLVVFFHMSTFTETPIISNSFIHNSDLFCRLLFVLSGFVIAHSYQFMSEGSQLRKFYKKTFLAAIPPVPGYTAAVCGYRTIKTLCGQLCAG